MKWKLVPVFALAVCMLVIGYAQAAPKAYVAEFGANDVAVIDTAHNSIVKQIPVPKGAHGLVITPDGSRVFVSSDESSIITVIDSATDSVVGSIPTGKAPHGLVASRDGAFIYAAIFGDNQILQIDSHTLKVVRTLEAPSPHNLAVTPDGKTLFAAAQQPGKTGIAEFDLRSGKMVTLVATEAVPRSLNVSPAGDILSVTLFDHNTLQVFSTRPLKQTASIEVGEAPHHTIFTANGKLILVANQSTNDVSIIDTKLWKVTAKIPVGQKPHWIAPSSDGIYAYVTDEISGQVSVLDLEEKKVEATIHVEAAPRKIAIQPGVVPEVTMGKTEDAPEGNHVVVKMQGPPPRFAPETVTIEAGTTVEWINSGTKVHTVTGDDGAWDSGSMEPGEKFSHRFDHKGTFKYYCVPHHDLGMTGTIIVK
ncbi:MAG TPA: cytochrome D1 domain-containing protein [Acidobacteriota bacterium]|nr:cytochrome D1 domain-containing protein [Acidobacteriota bacterium]